MRLRSSMLGAAMACAVVASPPSLDPPALVVDPDQVAPVDGARASTIRLEAGTATVRARVEITPATPVVGERVQVRFTATDRAGRDLGRRIEFGRDTELEPSSSRDCPSDLGGLPHAVGDVVTHLSDTNEYEFHTPGRHALKAYVTFQRCPGDHPRGFLALPGHIEVLPGGPTPNVGYAPTTEVSVSPRPQGTWYGHEVSVSVEDFDGFVDSLHVDFGDGTKPETTQRKGPRRCREHPAQSTFFRASAQKTYFHYFSGPGTFRIRVNATTTSCEGTHAQTVTTDHLVTI